MLRGSAGNDRFDFNSLAESRIGSGHRDIVSDFIQGRDKIDLSTIDAIIGTAADDAFDFIGGNAFSVSVVMGPPFVVGRDL